MISVVVKKNIKQAHISKPEAPESFSDGMVGTFFSLGQPSDTDYQQMDDTLSHLCDLYEDVEISVPPVFPVKDFLDMTGHKVNIYT